jgi:hypothetical protein
VEPLPDLPPKVPEELAELDRALQLLGAVCQAGTIKKKHHAELDALLGCKVTQQLASHWKTRLKEIRRDVAAERKKSLEPSTDPSKPTTETPAPSAEPAPAVIVSPLACEPIMPEAPALPSLPAGPKDSAPPEKRLHPNDRDLPIGEK